VALIAAAERERDEARSYAKDKETDCEYYRGEASRMEQERDEARAEVTKIRSLFRYAIRSGPSICTDMEVAGIMEGLQTMSDRLER